MNERPIAEYLEQRRWIAEGNADYGVFVVTASGIDQAMSQPKGETVLRDIELFLFAPIVVVLLVGLMLWFFFLRERRLQGSHRRAGALREEVEGTTGKRIYPPIHPGELLREEFLEPMEITPDELAEGTGVPVQHIRELVREKGKITPELSSRLGRYFGMSEEFWMRVQARYDQEVEQDRREREAG